MPRPTDELRADHDVVECGLSVLSAIGGHVRAGGSFPADDCAVVLSFLREFLVATHFRKENEIVWPALAMRRNDDVAAAVGDLMRAQDEASELIGSLVFFWEPVGDLTAPERLGFADTIDGLRMSLQRLQTTEERLFGKCDTGIPPDDQLDWSEQFAAIESERSSRGFWAARLQTLAAFWK